MPILQELLIKGYIDTKSEEKYAGIQKVKCPFCNSEYNLEDGIYSCPNCKKLFRKIGLATIDGEKVTNATADYIIHLLVYCAKADGNISSSERDYILEYIESFEMNEDQESWAFAQYDYARFTDYNKETITLLKESITHLLDSENLELDLLYDMLNLFFIDNSDFNDEQSKIITDYISIFEISSHICEKMINEIYKIKNNSSLNKPHQNNEDNLEEYYKILGLEKGCSEHDLKKKYAELTKSYHPDKYSSQDVPDEVKKQFEDMYKKINLAYDKLRENI